jgi:peptidoglycan-associated lipoprotein
MHARVTAFVCVVLSSSVLACSHQAKPPVSPRVFVARSTPVEPTRRIMPRQAVPAPQSKEAAREEGPLAIFFDFDSAQLRDEDFSVLEKFARSGHRFGLRLRVEGNCDELGTVEYNLALGEHRARAAKDYLVHLGVPRDRVTTISFGAQNPKYFGANDEAFAKNRRDDLIVVR